MGESAMLGAETQISSLDEDENHQIPGIQAAGDHPSESQGRHSTNGRISFHSVQQNGSVGSESSPIGFPSVGEIHERKSFVKSSTKSSINSHSSTKTKDASLSNPPDSMVKKQVEHSLVSMETSTSIDGNRDTYADPSTAMHNTELRPQEITQHSTRNHHPTPKKTSSRSEERNFIFVNTSPAHRATTLTSSNMLNHVDSSARNSISSKLHNNLKAPSSLSATIATSNALRTKRPVSMPPLTNEKNHIGSNVRTHHAQVVQEDSNYSIGVAGVDPETKTKYAGRVDVSSESLSHNVLSSPLSEVSVQGGSMLTPHSGIAYKPVDKILSTAQSEKESSSLSSSLVVNMILPRTVEHRSSADIDTATVNNSKRKQIGDRSYENDSSQIADVNSVVADRSSCRDYLPFGLRNKKMKPTDCLLFAATLLEEDGNPSGNCPSDDSLATANVDHSVLAEPHDSSGVTSQVADSESFLPETFSTTTLGNIPEGVSRDFTKPRDVDVLCGRGGLINKHPGNVIYRKVVDYNKPFYQSVHKKHRILVSQSIVQSILNFGGRFLILGSKGKAWMEIGYKRAVQKTSQALRERSSAPEDELDEDAKKSDGDSNVDTDDDDGEESEDTSGF